MKKVIVAFANGFEDIEALSVVDILRRAEIKVVMASICDIKVTSSHGVTILADEMLKNVKYQDFDAIVLPGGWPGAKHLNECEDLKKILRKFKAQNKLICAICAAPLVLKNAGVLSKNYTCYPSFEKEVNQSGYQKTDIVKDENIITANGPANAMKFALEIVKNLLGEEKNNELLSDLLIK